MPVNVQQAKTQRSELLVAAEAGEEVVIARDGAPVARLVPVSPAAEGRRPGFADSELWMSNEFDELPGEIASAERVFLSRVVVWEVEIKRALGTTSHRSRPPRASAAARVHRVAAHA